MPAFLDSIRCADKKISVKKQFINSSAIMLFGIILGAFSKFLENNLVTIFFEYLDNNPVNISPAFIFECSDIVFSIANFLSRFAIWVFLALCVSVYSASPIRAAINVFLFFAGMVASYYLYTNYIAGFFPKSYAMIWVGFTVISPVLAFLCWYAKGFSKVSLALSSGIIAVLFNMTFVYRLPGYINIRSALELLVFICGCVVMRRQTVKESVLMMVIGVVLAPILDIAIPSPFRFVFHFG